MSRVDYDTIASEYDRRYARQSWAGLASTLTEFLDGCSQDPVAEVGCGTGRWLSVAHGKVGQVYGIDLSWGMLTRARDSAPNAALVRATAEALPLADASVTRLFCINALHHFSSAERFVGEARRVLRPGGALLTISLDPHTRLDTWWIYDYFPAALVADRERYPSSESIRELMVREGLREASTRLAQRMSGTMSLADARARGLLDRRSTSQLMVISDSDFAAGIARVEREQPVLGADLRLYATTARVP